ncbi:MAG: hypothetical protein IID45_13565 [Planctomycetes bacterium]|nr:hypothetical protein [Planctomycetota bacterium]
MILRLTGIAVVAACAVGLSAVDAAAQSRAVYRVSVARDLSRNSGKPILAIAGTKG